MVLFEDLFDGAAAIRLSHDNGAMEGRSPESGRHRVGGGAPPKKAELGPGNEDILKSLLIQQVCINKSGRMKNLGDLFI